MIRHLDLFSGIGGFALAVRWLGGQTVAFCDNEVFCQAVLGKNFPGVPVHDDIRTLKGDVYGAVDLVTGGFPCQPFSVAGKRRGQDDDRFLWPEMARVIDEARPTYVLAENVPGFVSVALDEALADLEGLGYSVGAVVVPAVAVDALHIRERLWIMAHRDDGQRIDPDGSLCAGRDAAERRGQCLADTTGIGKREPADEAESEPGRRQARDESRSCRQHASHSHGSRCSSGLQHLQAGQSHSARGGRPVATTHGDRQQQPARSIEELGDGSGDRRTDASDTHDSGCQEQRVCFEADPEHTSAEWGGWWPPEPGVGRVAHGIPRRVDRLRSLGNAIVPQVAYELLRVMLAEEIAA